MNTILNNFKNLSITNFLENIDNNKHFWVIKRLSGNDTGATGGHQSGLYLPKKFVENAFPEINRTDIYNPKTIIQECYFPNQDHVSHKLKAIYYNSKYFPKKGLKKKYDEFRLTSWGGKSAPVQDVEKTGSICVFCPVRKDSEPYAVAWITETIEEENIIESWLGSEVIPGKFYTRFIFSDASSPVQSIPDEWYDKFPSSQDIFNFIESNLTARGWEDKLGKLLLKRRDEEFKIFQILEQKEVLPKIEKGFKSVETFIKYAHSISNRRKSRSGSSLEHNLSSIFSFKNIFFETHVVTENKKKPDFIFPSAKAYHSDSFSVENLTSLASKTTCKDRWRQVINEANRIGQKHLFTLQEGVSSNQLKEMYANNVYLVIPEANINLFPREWRNSIITIGCFVETVLEKQKQIKDIDIWIH